MSRLVVYWSRASGLEGMPMRRFIMLALLILAVAGCSSLGQRVGEETGLTPRQRDVLAQDYYLGIPGQSAEDLAAIAQARAILAGTADAEPPAE